jgi:ribosome biogenesis GTPase
VANIDILVIVVAAASPEPNMLLIDKLLVNSSVNGITPIICVNKTDVKSGEYIRKIYERAGYTVLTVSALLEEGFAELLP